MKILFYTTVFAPNVGGIEKLAETLCRQFVLMGHDVRLVTETLGEADMPFEVIRRPTKRHLLNLLTWCDVHLQANVSLKMAWMRFFALKKTVYQHNNVYQRDDGSKGVLDHFKTALAHTTPSIANSHYTAVRTGTKDVIFNAYDERTFSSALGKIEKDRDLVFLGRLVSQKGCDVLIDALEKLAIRGLRPNLSIIGSGNDRTKLEQQILNAGLGEQVRFLGAIQGEMLANELARHRFMVVPSRYEEPFGIVALEGLASGCIPVVSRQGGLTDAIGGHGITFPNGDAEALADLLDEALRGVRSASACLAGVEKHLARFRSEAVAERYINVFKKISEANS